MNSELLLRAEDLCALVAVLEGIRLALDPRALRYWQVIVSWLFTIGVLQVSSGSQK